MDNTSIKKIIRDQYGKIASRGNCCGSCTCGSLNDNEQISRSIGYSEEEIRMVPEANLGLGCGNPLALGAIRPGDVVLDLGSGAGFDAFLAASKTGKTGKVIGVDITKEMVDLATANAERYGYDNVEFKLGDIENLPIEDGSIDTIISNCVINLAPDKSKVFAESYRVLKNGGRMYVSDIVLLEDITENQKNDKALLAGCVAGALLRDNYLKIIKDAGFKVEIMSEDKGISKRQYQGIPLESLKVGATK